MSAPDPQQLHPDDLFHASLELVERVARQVARSVGPDFDLAELVSFGRVGLLAAARRFDPARGVPFRAYASYRIRGAILDEVRRARPLPRGIYRRLRSVEAADRLALEGDVWRSSHSESAQAEAWLEEHLARIATAMALGLLPEAAPPDGASGNLASPEAQMEHAELKTWLRQQVATLPAVEAELLERHYFKDQRFDEAARELGLSKSWASRLHARAIERLTKRLRQRSLGPVCRSERRSLPSSGGR